MSADDDLQTCAIRRRGDVCKWMVSWGVVSVASYDVRTAKFSRGCTLKFRGSEHHPNQPKEPIFRKRRQGLLHSPPFAFISSFQVSFKKEERNNQNN
jgi:hypothetical protein